MCSNDPFVVLGLSDVFHTPLLIADPMDYDPATRYQPYSRRTRRYHFGRVRYFTELLLLGEKLDPIVVDNACWNLRVLPIPVVLDGYHRLCAAILVGKQTIRASYSGRIDVLRWLEGKRKKCPET